MELKTDKKTINEEQNGVFEFLEHPANFEELMPSSIEKFELVEEDQFNFQLSGMPEIRLKMTSKSQPDEIVLTSASDKFNFDLSIHIGKVSESESEVQLFFTGNFNSMMAMMIKNPISKFINKLVENLEMKYQA